MASASVRSATGDEVLALELFDQRVFAVEAGRRAFERLAAEREALRERRLFDDRLPAGRARGDRGADGVQGVAVRAPGAAGHEHASGLEVHVEAGRVDVARAGVAELDAEWVL